ncbi:hypothetical protein ABZX92_32485 [Lentzea sp. NPDC006480]|uniref:hypothetical protein n=1 Tax=Lentzea sp. NPDC006480 TaxID=3157176 RepID=UPI0033AFBEA8
MQYLGEVPVGVEADIESSGADARDWASHMRPIPADVLRKELEIATVQARELIAVIRREVAAKVCAEVA